jgi:hypothetical protein
MPRHFIGKAERRESFEAYREEPRKELVGVEERIEELSA